MGSVFDRAHSRVQCCQDGSDFIPHPRKVRIPGMLSPILGGREEGNGGDFVIIIL